MSIEIFKSMTLRKSGFKPNWYFRIVGRNGKTIAQSEGYTRKRNALQTIKRYWPRALVEEVQQ